ncbi:hypothetical protein EP7_005386 [Isosphaeraceae bacterium EP7]
MHDIRAERRVFLGTLAALFMTGRISRRIARADDAKPDPFELARKVEALYASCKTYRDQGKAVQIFLDAKGNDRAEGETKPRLITTAFARPDKFRFEFDDERDEKRIRNLIWMDGTAVKTWWDIRPGVQKPNSLQFALGAAAGVTESASMTIAPLLLPELLGRPHALSEGPGVLSQLEDGSIGEHACRRLRRRFEAVNFQTRKKFEVVDTYWIDAKTHAVRRVVKEMQHDEFRSVGTLDLEPEFDVELPASALEFDPPQN